MISFLIQSDLPNKWWTPTKAQYNAIKPLYLKWVSNLGQSGMQYEGTEVTNEVKMGEFNYLIKIDGSNSYLKNLTHKDHRVRLIHFLPSHDGAT